MAPDGTSEPVKIEDVDSIVMNDIEVDPSALLVVPTDEDVDIVREMFESEFEEIEDQYNRLPAEPETAGGEYVMTKGSLLQELIAQLNAQETDDE